MTGDEIINWDSLNIDHVYNVDQFVRPGETIPSLNYQQHCGGKEDWLLLQNEINGIEEIFETAEPLAKLISSVTSQSKELIRKQSDNPKHQVHHNLIGATNHHMTAAKFFL